MLGSTINKTCLVSLGSLFWLLLLHNHQRSFSTRDHQRLLLPSRFSSFFSFLPPSPPCSSSVLALAQQKNSDKLHPRAVFRAAKAPARKTSWTCGLQKSTEIKAAQPETHKASSLVLGVLVGVAGMQKESWRERQRARKVFFVNRSPSC